MGLRALGVEWAYANAVSDQYMKIAGGVQPFCYSSFLSVKHLWLIRSRDESQLFNQAFLSPP